MADDKREHAIMETRRPSRTISDYVHAGIRATDEEIGRLQPQWDVPEKAMVLSDIGHHLYADEVVEESKACVRAGASSIHLHIKDDEDNPTGDKEIWKQVISEIREENPNVVIDAGLRGETFEEQMYFIREGYFDVIPISQSGDPDYYEDVIEVINANNARPRLTVFCPSDIVRAKAQYIDTGLIETPAIWAPMIGNPYHGVYMSDQTSMIRILLYMIESIQDIDPGAFIMVTASNRASNYLATLTAMLGHHLRIGMGETRWRFPHTDEKLTQNETAVNDALSALDALGREPATPEEYREMIGLDTR